jgi:hypothetical protein
MQKILDENYDELIITQTLGNEFANATDKLEIYLPGLTNGMKKLELLEMKIWLEAPDIGSTDVQWTTFDIRCPLGGVTTPNGSQIKVIPALIETGTALFKEFHKNNVVLLKLNAKNTTETSRVLTLQFLKTNNLPLAKNRVYLRFGLLGTRTEPPDYLRQPLDWNRFQGQ